MTSLNSCLLFVILLQTYQSKLMELWHKLIQIHASLHCCWVFCGIWLDGSSSSSSRNDLHFWPSLDSSGFPVLSTVSRIHICGPLQTQVRLCTVTLYSNNFSRTTSASHFETSISLLRTRKDSIESCFSNIGINSKFVENVLQFIKTCSFVQVSDVTYVFLN